MCSTGDYSAVFISTWPKARKPHVCSECFRLIPAGVRYRRVFVVQERGDGPVVDAVHAECEVIREFVEREICQPEEDRNTPKWRHHPRRAQIFVGGLGEEVAGLNEYGVRESGEEEDIRALGFDPGDDERHGDGVREVVRWVWDLAVGHYPKAEART